MNSKVKFKRPELLAPAGNFEKLKFAFQYGADAVYAGVPLFSLRARENQFNPEKVQEAIDYTRKLNKTIYLTLNIFPHNFKLKALKEALQSIAKMEPDAMIVADPGVIEMCKEYAPKVPLHLSVQANTVNWMGARFWHKQGVERVILPRELTIKEIKEFHDNNPKLELEAFVHGAICIAYSGRCLLSNYFSWRDANQGTCAHSCRWKYKMYKGAPKEGYGTNENYEELDGQFFLEEETRPGSYLPADEDEYGTYIMNAKDICLIEFLQDLVEAGIISLKIEGRSKSIYYLANVVKTYRQAIDDMMAGKKLNKAHFATLAKTANRGFIPGFAVDNPKEVAQNYETAAPFQTDEFAGVIRKVLAKNLYEVEMRNRVEVGTELEIVTPETEEKFKLKKMYNLDKEPIKIAHGGAGNAIMELTGDLPEGTIMRQKARKVANPFDRGRPKKQFIPW